MVRMFHFRAYFSSLTRFKARGGGGGGGGGEEESTQQMFYTGRLRPEIQLLTLL